MNRSQAEAQVAEFFALEATLESLLAEATDEPRVALLEVTLAWVRALQRAIADGDEPAKAALLAQGTEALAALGAF